MTAKIKVVVVGLGQIGIETCKLILEKKSLSLLAVVDIDNAKQGKDLGEFLGKKNLGIKISNDLRETLKEFQPEVTVLTSKSRLVEIANDIFVCLENHSSVISTCEELLFPFINNLKLSEEIDQKAKENFVHVLGTGVNPGFVMDTLPTFLTSVCSRVNSLTIYRLVDLNKRRKALQTKMGLGKSKNEFMKLVKSKQIGHIGLLESAQFINHNLKLNIKSFSESISPVLASKNLKTKYFEIPKGTVAGSKHVVVGKVNSKKVLELVLEMRADIKESIDEIKISGTPSLHVKFEGGIHGDIATAAMVVNSIPNLLHARYGLITMRDIIIPSVLNF